MIHGIQRLDIYSTPPSWHTGASLRRRVLWRLFGLPLLASHLPGTAWRQQLLRVFGARIGAGGRLKPQLHITFPWRLVIGDHCWLGEKLWIDNLAPVTLGDNVCLSQGAYLCTGNHDFHTPGFDLRLGSITVESESWIAARAVLAPGTRVCTGAVVALGAVASGTVLANAIVQGNPAQVVGWRSRRR